MKNNDQESDGLTGFAMDFASAAVVVFLTWMIHESGHWIVSEALGNPSFLRINSVGPKSGSYVEDWHVIAVAISGPIVTVIQAVVAFWFLKKSWNGFVYFLCFVPFYMRTLAGGISFLQLNDEAKVSYELGLPAFVLPVVVIFFLGVLVVLVSRKHQLGFWQHLKTTLLVMFWSSVLILYDQFVGMQFV